ncbi:MAG: Nif3-like dinuclear metal center hexameric protein [Candidatus Sigynarchaeota archaeon]
MYLENIINTLKSLSPPWLTLRANEEQGLVFGRKTDISSIVIRKGVLSIDPTLECIDEAVASKANLIISHHALAREHFFKIREIAFEKTRLLTENNIWVYVLGDAWNHSTQGITDSVCQALRLESKEIYTLSNFQGDEIPVGRICEPNGTRTLDSILDQAKNLLGRNVITYKGDPERVYKRILVIGGKVDSIQPVLAMLERKIDLLIAGELHGEVLTILSDLRIAFIEISHYTTDILGMSKLKALLSLKHPNVTFALHDENPVQRV